MYLIPDDPIIRSMERTGYPPWIHDEYDSYCDITKEEDEEEQEEEE